MLKSTNFDKGKGRKDIQKRENIDVGEEEEEKIKTRQELDNLRKDEFPNIE